ncbi:MAG: methionine synthase [Candidatus Eremiobacteraeota bacterium]|nr:methionine synthase [Candidatus Eremiobacteraeota bacterium]
MRFETTIAGSLPKPPWLAEPERLWPTWRLEGSELLAAQHDAVRVSLFEEEHAGIDVVTDGEQARQHFVHGFAGALEGVDARQRARRGIRGDRYEADCPRIVGEVRRTRSIHAGEARFARAATARKLKFTLPGPMTIVDTLVDEFYGSRKDAAFACARALRVEIEELVALGVDVIQLDEPAFNVYFDEVDEWGIAALDEAFGDARCEKAVHVCYGYGVEANVAWKARLGEEWDQYAALFPMLDRSRADIVLMELAGSHVPPRVLDLLPNKAVAVGVIDVASDRIESAEDVRAVIEIARAHLPDERIKCTTNCGMAPMKRDVAYAKLRALGAGAALARTSA